MGPGLMVCFADTDGPCLITAAQSGAEWTYDLLMLQIVLAPILFFAQELTVRLAIIRGVGVTAMIKEDVGVVGCWLVAGPLLVSCCLGLLSEYTVIGNTMAFWGWPVWVTSTGVTVILLSLAITGSYSVAEKVGLAMGACQVLFFFTLVAAKPKGDEVADGLISFPLGEEEFVKLVTANIGAVIMPWMLAYQQSAICEKGQDENRVEHLWIERIDTAVGSVVTQAVMAAMLMTVAAAKWTGPIDTVHDLLTIFTHILGSETAARWILTFAVVGACMVAAIVQTLCAAWVFEEAVGRGHGAAELLEDAPCIERLCQNMRHRPLFFGSYSLVCCAALLITCITDDAVDLSVFTEFTNGILMPPVVFALWYLSAWHLPEEFQLGLLYKWFLFLVFMICSVFCIGSIVFVS